MRRAYSRSLAHIFPTPAVSTWLQDRFDLVASKAVPTETDIFVGWSSFSERALNSASSYGAVTIVERGSSHIEFQRDLLADEYRRLGIDPAPHVPPPAIVEKELREYEIADFISVPSNFARRTFLERGFPPEKIIQVPYGVDISALDPPLPSDGIFRVLQVGGLTPRKGVQYLLEAWSGLSLPGAELWLVGSISDEIRPTLSRYAGSFRHFEPVRQAELHHFYERASVFALCSIEEGMAMVIPQAMASGLPVICTENTGAADLIDDGREGFVIPTRDVKVIRECIVRLFEDSQLRSRMAEAARAKVEAAGTWDHYGARIFAEYERVLATVDGAAQR